MHFKISIKAFKRIYHFLTLILLKKYNLSIAGEWWFGNILWLYRVIYLNQKSLIKKYKNISK